MKKFLFLLVFFLWGCSPYPSSSTSQDASAPTTKVIFSSASIISTSINQPEDSSKTLQRLAEIHDIVEQRRTDLVSEPGWLYLRTRMAGENNTLFSNWGIDLDQYEQEKWLYLDQTGRIITGVNRILNQEQQVLQLSTFKDGRWRNLTLGAESPEANLVSFDPNFGFYELAAQLVQQGQQLNSSTIYKDCWYQGERYTISDGVNYYEAVFNPHRMSLRWIKTYHIIAGSIVLVNSMEVMIEKRIPEPPSEILALLDEPLAYTEK